MFPLPQPALSPNSYAYETQPLVKPTGFREYDARWLFRSELNLMGVQVLGLGLGMLIHERGVRPDIVVGHDFRSYSASIKHALANGLIAAGIRVYDIGLALSPIAYFAQFALDIPCVAMVTASHNENGWTGVKMGIARPLTFGPDEMSRLKDIVLNGLGIARAGGSYRYVPDVPEIYMKDLVSRPRLNDRIKAVVACGNGTAGAFAPRVLETLGVEVVPLDCELDFSFPRYNPDPGNVDMLYAMRDAVLASGADVGFGFDGDGDRCGVVDNEGEEIFADKVGVMLARDLSFLHPGAAFVVDVKSTCLFQTDPVLRANGAATEYWKTGHSYMKRRVSETGALAGFEKSGHYFFNAPVGRGYDDGLVSAIAILDMLDRNPGCPLAALKEALPKTWCSSPMFLNCSDESKYSVVAAITRHFEAMAARGARIDGQKIRALVTISGVRVTMEDGSWGVVQASSHKPELVVVVESPVSETRMRSMFVAMDGVLRANLEVGDHNQPI